MLYLLRRHSEGKEELGQATIDGTAQGPTALKDADVEKLYCLAADLS
jgi:hypothetical protein